MTTRSSRLLNLRRQEQELLDLGVVGLPELAVMFGIFDQDFVRPR